jgi:GT2 family glycosyltransferase
MLLSLIILNYKTKNLVKNLLIDILGFNLPFTFEIIVVDNDSQDGIGEMLKKEFPVVKFFANSRNLGMGSGNNLGIQNSSGRYLLIANPDITLNQAGIIKLVEFLERQEKAGIVAPKILNPDGTAQETCFRWPDFHTFLYRRTSLDRTQKGRAHLDHYLYRDENLNQAKTVDWVLGGCFLARRLALDKAGLFDERFFLFLEDTDLCRRVYQAGLEVWYLPEAAVIHLPHRLSSGEGSLKDLFSRLTWVHIISWLKYFWKWRKDNTQTNTNID